MTGDLGRAAATCLFPSFDGVTAPDWVLRWLERGLGGRETAVDAVHRERPGGLVGLHPHAERGERCLHIVGVVGVEGVGDLGAAASSSR